MDPGRVDRRTSLIAGVNENDLPVRRMTIAGLEGSLDARTLSKDTSGAATLLVDFDIGWRADVAGAFTADIEIYMLDGELTFGGKTIASRDYLAIRAGDLVLGLRTLSPGRALFMTAAPIRYDTAAGGVPAPLDVVRTADLDWRPLPGHDGRFVKSVRSGVDGEVWLSGSLEWDHRDGLWHRHAGGEECYVIDGEITLVEESADGSGAHTYGPGGYVSRPPGALHVGPGSRASDTALTFHRAWGGPLVTEWVGDQSAPVGDA